MTQKQFIDEVMISLLGWKRLEGDNDHLLVDEEGMVISKFTIEQYSLRKPQIALRLPTFGLNYRPNANFGCIKLTTFDEAAIQRFIQRYKSEWLPIVRGRWTESCKKNQEKDELKIRKDFLDSIPQMVSVTRIQTTNLGTLLFHSPQTRSENNEFTIEYQWPKNGKITFSLNTTPSSHNLFFEDFQQQIITALKTAKKIAENIENCFNYWKKLILNEDALQHLGIEGPLYVEENILTQEDHAGGVDRSWTVINANGEHIGSMVEWNQASQKSAFRYRILIKNSSNEGSVILLTKQDFTIE